MENKKKRPNNILVIVSNLEKKHKVITYASLLFLTVSTYFLRTENQRIKIDFETIKERNVNLKNNMVIFNRNYENFPFPVWQKIKKGDEFIMQYVNKEYVKNFGHLFNYDPFGQIGKSNYELYPEEFAKIYHDNDMAAALSGKEIETLESFLGKDNKLHHTKTLKWREIKDDRDTLIYGLVKDFIISPDALKN